MSLTAAHISQITGAPRGNVEDCWPALVAALDEQGIRSDMVEVAMAATVAVETGIFRPLRERLADKRHQLKLYTTQMRYWPSGYYGRGYIQLTWEANYRAMGLALNLDLLGHPELACRPDVAARILAYYFRHEGVAKAADVRDWARTRRLVNGGLTGWEDYKRYVAGLLGVLRA